MMVRDLTEPYATPVDLIANFEHQFHFVGNDGPLFYFKTDLDAPRRRLVAIDLAKPQPERLEGNHPAGARTTLGGASMVDNQFDRRAT